MWATGPALAWERCGWAANPSKPGKEGGLAVAPKVAFCLRKSADGVPKRGRAGTGAFRGREGLAISGLTSLKRRDVSGQRCGRSEAKTAD